MAIYLPPTLTSWTEGRLTAILQASTQDDFDQAFDNFLSQDANITLNGCPLSRDDYKAQLQTKGALNNQSATVKFDASIEVPDDKVKPKQSGLVSIFFDATIVEKMGILPGPTQRKVTSALNVTINPDASFATLKNPEFEARRVSVLNQVVTDEQLPIRY